MNHAAQKNTRVQTTTDLHNMRVEKTRDIRERRAHERPSAANTNHKPSTRSRR